MENEQSDYKGYPIECLTQSQVRITTPTGGVYGVPQYRTYIDGHPYTNTLDKVKGWIDAVIQKNRGG